MYVCTRVCVCIYMYARVCMPVVHARARVWRPEVNLGCCPLGVIHIPFVLKVFLFLCVCMLLVYAGIIGGQKRAPLKLDPLELELQAVVNHLMQMLGTALESSARAISRAPIFLFEARSFTWPGTCQTGQTTWPAGTGCPLVSNVLALRFQVYLGLCCCFWFVCFFI